MLQELTSGVTALIFFGRGISVLNFPNPVKTLSCLMYMLSRSVVSDSLQPHRLWSARLLCPWDFQARMLEWVAFPFSRGSSQPRGQTQVPHIAGGFFTVSATRDCLVSLGKFSVSGMEENQMKG